MDNYKRFGLIAGQVLIGLGFAFLGLIAFGLLIIIYFKLIDEHLDLFGQIMFAVIGGYIGMQTGVGYDGYNFLKDNDRQSDFIRFFSQSILGLIIGFFTLYIITSSVDKISNGLTNFLAISVPLTGAIIGFNLGLSKKIRDNKINNG